MPITLQISHPDRMAIGVMRGLVTGEDLYQFTVELAAAGAGRYRKIIDVIGYTAGLTEEEIAAFSTRMHETPVVLERGPIAIVADRATGPLSEVFARLMDDERPVKVFRSIHVAREWLQANTGYP